MQERSWCKRKGRCPFQKLILSYVGPTSNYTVHMWTSRSHLTPFSHWEDPMDPSRNLKEKCSQRETELPSKPNWLPSRYVHFSSKLSVQGKQKNDSVQTLNTQPVSTCPCHRADIYILLCAPCSKTLRHSFYLKTENTINSRPPSLGMLTT